MLLLYKNSEGNSQTRMTHGAKSIWSEANIQDKINRGADGIEIQLRTPNPDKEINDSLPKEQLDLIKAIHMPIGEGRDQYSVTTHTGIHTLTALINRVNLIKELKGVNWDGLHIICHYIPVTDEDTLEYKNNVIMMRLLAAQNKSLVFCVENTTDGYNGQNIKFVKDVSESNVGTCLDTCHSLIVEHDGGMSMDELFRQNFEVCAHMHLCDAKDTGEGYGKGEGHGVPFTSRDSKDLLRIIALYRCFNYNADVVYEVREDDYLNCVNYSKIKEQVGARLA